jgi:type IV pilus assembly protein PilW
VPLTGAPIAPISPFFVRIYYVSCNSDSATACGASGGDGVPTLQRLDVTPGATVVTPVVDGIENLQFDYGIDMDGNGSPDCYTSNPNSPPGTEVAVAVCPQTTPAYDWTSAAANWANVMTVRIHVLARNTEGSGGWTDTRTYDRGRAVPAAGPFNDRIKRHVYSTVARLYNSSGQRETP